MLSTTGSVSPNLWVHVRSGISKSVDSATRVAGRGYLVLIILRNAPMDVILVTMWALPVQQSVTVMTGHENVRNASKDSKNTPQDRSYLVK
jgi:hypothetical protein